MLLCGLGAWSRSFPAPRPRGPPRAKGNEFHRNYYENPVRVPLPKSE